MALPLRTKRRFAPVKKFRPEMGEMTGWAVSYSDLLMVLLAFFLLYFQFGEKESASIIKSVIRDLDSHGASGGAGGQSGNAAALSASSLRSALESKGLEMEAQGMNGTVTVHFAANFFGPGQYQLGRQQQEKLAEVFDLLAPYQEKVDLVFIGHTDTSALAPARGRVVDSNLVLSNLRAARAAEFALLKGYDPQFVSSEGVGQYRRATRSLSIRIGERKRQ